MILSHLFSDSTSLTLPKLLLSLACLVGLFLGLLPHSMPVCNEFYKNFISVVLVSILRQLLARFCNFRPFLRYEPILSLSMNDSLLWPPGISFAYLILSPWNEELFMCFDISYQNVNKTPVEFSLSAYPSSIVHSFLGWPSCALWTASSSTGRV